MRPAARLAVALVVGGVAGGCASLGLGDVIQPPRFEIVEGRQAELRLLLPSADRPQGGAAVRIWTRVHNPNGFGFTLAHLGGTLFLEGSRGPDVDLPLGLPLLAQRDTIIPLDLSISFSEIPGLANVATRVVTGGDIGYRLDGTVTVDAGALGRPSFGPSTLLQGTMDVRR